MAWRLATALFHLKSEINGNWPKRDRASDGSIGNEEHANRKSDHNPDKDGVVRAHDFDDDFGPDDTIPFRLAEHLRRLGKSGFRPLRNGGLIIYYRKYCSEKTNWEWWDYHGLNEHKSHVHVSVGRDPFQYDCKDMWRIADIIRRPIPLEPPTTPELKDDKVYILVKGNASPDIWLTDGLTKRKMKDQDEINFQRMALGGTIKTGPNGVPEEWPQAYVDAINRSDANVVDATFRWWAASPEDNPLEELVNKILDERQKDAKTNV